MRTTLTLDDDVATLVRKAVHRQQRPTKRVINDALRRALAAPAPAEPFEVVPHHSAVRAGIDPHRLNRLADELADDDAAGTAEHE